MKNLEHNIIFGSNKSSQEDKPFSVIPAEAGIQSF